jgi:hypothetical protein
MKIIILLISLFAINISAQVDYQKYFTDACLRIHYYHYGNLNEEEVVPGEFYQDSLWAGSRVNLIDTLNLGAYLIKVSDLSSNLLIYSYGFSTLFNEWRTTGEALAGNSKVIEEVVRIPFPKHKILVELFKRDKQNHFTKVIGNWVIDPNSGEIRKENRATGVRVFDILSNGSPAQKVDLAFLAEGYNQSEMEKFEADVDHFTDLLFQTEPFKTEKGNFNIRAVFKPSVDSGVDDPARNQYKNTVLNASFSTFGSQRYLMTFDQLAVTDIASAVPHDALYVLVNSNVYGGGGIYNLYACITVDNKWSDNIFIHEFGHSFGGLGDEYYTSDVAYNDFYPTTVEPWEPNLTVLSNPNRVKWEKFILAGTLIPTPWGKDKFDQENKDYSGRYKKLNPENNSNKKMNNLLESHQEWIDHFFDNHPEKNKIGAFEGAGYASSGIYRPALECIMFSNRKIAFDPVCADAIRKRILFLSR